MVDDYVRYLLTVAGFSKRYTEISKVTINSAQNITGKSIQEWGVQDFEKFIQVKRNIDTSEESISVYYYQIRAYVEYLKTNYNLDLQHLLDLKVRFKIMRQKHKLNRTLGAETCLNLIKDVCSKKGWIEKRNGALLAVLYGTGMRIHEALMLTTDNVSENVFVISGKGKKERQVLLLKPVVEICKDYLAERPFSNIKELFINKEGGTLTYHNALYIIKNAGDSLGVDLTPHMFRSAFATHLMTNGVDLFTMKTLLGHASVNTTARYIKQEEEEQRNLLGTVFGNTLKNLLP